MSPAALPTIYVELDARDCMIVTSALRLYVERGGLQSEHALRCNALSVQLRNFVCVVTALSDEVATNDPGSPCRQMT